MLEECTYRPGMGRRIGVEHNHAVLQALKLYELLGLLHSPELYLPSLLLLLPRALHGYAIGTS